MSVLSNSANVSALPFKAGGVIIKDTFVKLDTTARRVVQATAATDVIIGVALQAAAAAGDPVQVQIAGVARVISNGTCALGEVECATDGEATTAGGATAHSVGVALTAAAADQDHVEVLLACPAVKRPPLT